MFVAIIPAYNEEEHINSVVRSLLGIVDTVVVVDDCSRDRTGEIARAAGAVVLRHRVNRGQGAALETGHVYARMIGADMVLHFDADGQFDATDISPARRALEESGADILIGSRFLDGRSTTIPFTKRYIILPIGRMLMNALFGSIPLSDAHNGFRILTARALERIVITQDGMAHASEIPMIVKKEQLRYIEFPVKVTYHEYGQSALGGFKIIRDLFLGIFVK